MRVIPFLFREVAQQLAHARVRRAARRGFVETFRFKLHGLGGFLHGLETEWPHQPDRPPLHKTPDVLPPDERHVITETTSVNVEQPMAMPVLFAPEFFELFGLFRIIVLQAVGEVVVNSGVFFLERDGQGEDFLFAESFKGSHRFWGRRLSQGDGDSLPPTFHPLQPFAFPGCEPSGLSGPRSARSNGKSPKPAGSKAYSTSRFMDRFQGFRPRLGAMNGGARLPRALISNGYKLGLDGISPHPVHGKPPFVFSHALGPWTTPLTRPSGTLSPSEGERAG